MIENDAASPTAPATIPGQLEYEVFILSGNINEELNKLGLEGWTAFGLLPQPVDASGAQRIMVPCHRPRRLIQSAAGNGVVVL